MDNLLRDTKEILALAREHYGYKNQILVAIEELNELASVLPKYPRYDLHEEAVKALREAVLDECSDILNVIDHIQAIFDISDEELIYHAAEKMRRVAKWLFKETAQASVEDREIPDKPCPLCVYNGGDPFMLPCLHCNTQPGYQGFVLDTRDFKSSSPSNSEN